MKNDDAYAIAFKVLLRQKSYAKDNIAKAKANLCNVALESEYVSVMGGYDLKYRGAVLKGLTDFAKSGNYMDLLASQPYSTSIVDDYLQSLGKCRHGFGSFHDNIEAARTLRRKVGPSNFNKRLTSFLKRKIDKMVK